MASLSEAQELLSEEQKAARDADLDARLEKLKLEVNQEPIHIPHPETVKATEELLERLAALRQEHAAATATADAFRKSIAKLPEKCSIEELKAKFKEGAAEAPETINYGDHASQYYRVHRPSVPEPWWAVLIIHGGFWREKYNISNAAIETIAPALARRGFCAIEVEYRRVGGGGGWPESCDDVDAALKHCIENVAGLSERRIVLVGHSAGGHAALMCAANAQTAPRLVVAIAPVADLVHAHEKKLSDDGEAVLNFVGAAPDLRPDLYEAACPTKSQIWSRLRSDIVLATGTEDVDVPVELTRLFYHRRHRSGVKLVRHSRFAVPCIVSRSCSAKVGLPLVRLAFFRRPPWSSMSICGEMDASPATTLVDLPKEVLGVVGGFADPVGVFGCLAKATRDACDLACQTLARARYPAWALPNRLPLMSESAESYPSWRALIADDNARAGMWCLDVGTGSSIAGANARYYDTYISRVARDPANSGQLVVIMEERGENDLGSVHTSSWGPRFNILVNDWVSTHYGLEPGVCKRIRSVHEYILRTDGHAVCRLYFPSVAGAHRGIGYSAGGLATGWDKGHSIGFEYSWPTGGTTLIPYGPSPCFLQRGEFKTWEAAFRGPGLPPGAWRRSFVPRPLPYADVAIELWDLPPSILARHRRGKWGV